SKVSSKFPDLDTHTLASSNKSLVYQLNAIPIEVSPLIVVIIRFGVLFTGTSATAGFSLESTGENSSCSAVCSAGAVPAACEPPPPAPSAAGLNTADTPRAAANKPADSFTTSGFVLCKSSFINITLL